MRNSLLSLAAPVECHVCHREVTDSRNGIACSECWAETTLFIGHEMLCHKCGAFFGPRATPGEVYCHKCTEHHYESARALGIYEKALAATILRLKREPVLPQILNKHLTGPILSQYSDVDILVSIPLSKQRLKERGYNQAAIIAESVGKALSIPIDAHSLERKVHTPIHRVGMDKRARELTVTNAFAVTRPNLVKDRRVLLVDDVLTSGSTASNCAKALKKAGAERVDVLTLARAVMR